MKAYLVAIFRRSVFFCARDTYSRVMLVQLGLGAGWSLGGGGEKGGFVNSFNSSS